MWKLKDGQPAIQVTKEGPFAYHTFKPGELYKEIPEEEAHRFEKVDPEKEGN